MITDFLSVTCVKGFANSCFKRKDFVFFSVSFWLQKTEKVWRIKTPNKKIERDFHSFVLSRVGTPTISWAHTLIIHLLCVCVEFLYSPDWTPQHFARVFVFVFFSAPKICFHSCGHQRGPDKKSSRICLDNWKLDESFSEMERESQ